MDHQEQEFKIVVGEPEMNSSDTFSYVTYMVKGTDKKGEFQIRRRYRDFHLLREKLVERWPGLYIPPISSKKLTGNTEGRFVQSRKNFLNYFCSKVAERPYLFLSDVFQLFVRGEGDFEKNAKELPPIQYEKLCDVYEKNFTQLTEKVSSAELQIMTETDYDFMKKAQKKLEKLRDEFRDSIDAKNQYEKQFNFCMKTVLPQYEQKFLLKYVEEDRSNLLITKDEKFFEKLQEYKEVCEHNPLEDYVQMISYELRQMRAFVQAIDSRKKAEETKNKLEAKRRQAKEEVQKLKAGKTTLKSVFTSGTKEEQVHELEESIPKWEVAEESLNKMIYLMNAATYTEIVNYKQRQSSNYPKHVHEISKKQIREMDIYGELLAIPLDD